MSGGMNTISSVDPGSPAQAAGIAPGERLKAVNGSRVRDVLDYMYYTYDPDPEFTLERPDGSEYTVRLRKEEGRSAGLEFQEYLMDSARSCANNCIFCFVDQMPPGMRDTLYFKDDDVRLSFLTGSYLTLTNLGEREVQRVIDLKISPINVSVHTMKPSLRCMMLGNRHDYTMRALSHLAPAVKSVAVIPVGLTKFREGLYPIKPFDKMSARRTVRQVERFGERCFRRSGSRIFFCSDELYLKAGLEVPEDSFYQGYPQLENGVGMLRLLYKEFEDALAGARGPARGSHISIATGVSAAGTIIRLRDMAKRRFPEIDVRVYPIVNDFFGHTIDVAGLITGRDLISQLRGRDLGERLYITNRMLKDGENVLLDDVTVEDLTRELGVPVVPMDNGGEPLLDVFLS